MTRRSSFHPYKPPGNHYPTMTDKELFINDCNNQAAGRSAIACDPDVACRIKLANKETSWIRTSNLVINKQMLSRPLMLYTCLD